MTAPPSPSIDSIRRMIGAGGTPPPACRAVSPRGSGSAFFRERRGFLADASAMGSGHRNPNRSGPRREGHTRLGRLQPLTLLQHPGPGLVLEPAQLGFEPGGLPHLVE